MVFQLHLSLLRLLAISGDGARTLYIEIYNDKLLVVGLQTLDVATRVRSDTCLRLQFGL